MKKRVEYGAVGLIGGVGYGGLELLFRGRTHWSMLLAGGASFSMMYAISGMKRRKRWEKCLLSSAAITAVEWVTGWVVNLRLGWKVWDYSGKWGNLKGQICPLFSFLWLLLSIPCTGLCALLRRGIFQKV